MADLINGSTTVNDGMIIDLFFARSEEALKKTDHKYRALLRTIALSITGDERDADETVNDVYLRAWNNIPPERPLSLRSYLSAICRHLALDRLEKDRASKRVNRSIVDELDDALPAAGTEEYDDRELSRLIDAFLRSLKKEHRIMFVKRYCFGTPVKEIARSFGVSEAKVQSVLQRTRKKLRIMLEKEGVSL